MRLMVLMTMMMMMDEFWTFMIIMMVLIMILMMILTMILTMILMMVLMVILMSILMMVGAGTEDQSWKEPYTSSPPVPLPSPAQVPTSSLLPRRPPPGEGFGTNGYFRRDLDVISRVPESTIDFLSFYIGFESLTSGKMVVLDENVGLVGFFFETLNFL